MSDEPKEQVGHSPKGAEQSVEAGVPTFIVSEPGKPDRYYGPDRPEGVPDDADTNKR